MNTTEQLKEIADSSASRIAKESLAIMEGFQKELELVNPLKDMKKKGDKFPAFNLPNHEGKIVSSDDILKNGPMIVTFYRGAWCPYCNIELRGYQNLLSEIKNKGATLVAISPEVPDNSLTLVEKQGLGFLVLSDIDNKLSKELGLVFQLSKELVDTYKSFGIDLGASQGNDRNELPAPATYIISKDGIITFLEAKLDYKTRTDPKAVLEQL